MEDTKGQATSVLSLVYNIIAIPYNLLAGFVVGSIVPVAAIAAIVGGIRLLTGKMPYLSSTDVEGERRVCIDLMTPEGARAAFAHDREEIGGQIERMSAEIQAIIEQARTQARQAAPAGLDETASEL
ncbi:MAG: hypothetical protein JXA93_15430 [Anaerolineae bacterium]|nr:hypothetical protein [Anaerolineae bacterium]